PRLTLTTPLLTPLRGVLLLEYPHCWVGYFCVQEPVWCISALGKTKQEFVDVNGVYEEVMGVAKGDYKQLEEDWANPLRRLLMRPLGRKYAEIQDQISDIVALRKATAKPVEERIVLVQAAIRDKVYEREFGILTFESFMGCLEPQLEEKI
ncbi:hypothetical protein EUX98_g9046, partial [Antrodiella citrinella]